MRPARPLNPRPYRSPFRLLISLLTHTGPTLSPPADLLIPGYAEETNRNAVSEDVDERTLFEMYLPPFEGAIKAGLGSVMCSCESPRARSVSQQHSFGWHPFVLTGHCRLSGGLSDNKINDRWSCENPTTLGYLKKDLNFTGWVMSDW